MNHLLTITSAALLLGACAQKNTLMNFAKDVHSFSTPNEVYVSHLNLDLTVDFNNKVLEGAATWDLVNQTGANEVIFDTKDLEVSKVTIDSKETSFTFGPKDSILGSALKIAITPTTKQVTIFYKTSANAEALQWLNPTQTAGKKYPFLFTQSQAILARTWIPCMDGPGVRFSYTAKVQVPKGYLALMSAINPQEKSENGEYQFVQERKIPSYLMALSVGDLEFKKIGARTGVYAEPVSLAAAYWEFEEMENMLVAAEMLYGPYVWGRYDVLLLPPSFPFGGMENPCLTFATPTIIAGDKSLTSLVAHELAHSWSGNLVTNATWNDFWLNEGFTVYFERRIMESLYGPSYAEMLTYLGYTDLKNTVNDFGVSNPDTRLKIDLAGRNPDDGVSDIAYEKGFFFLKTLEKQFGRDAFDIFLKKYFESHAFGSIETETFIEYIKEHLFKGDTVLMQQVKVNEWIYETGLPANFPTVTSKRFEQVDAQVATYLKTKNTNDLQTKEWTSHEWLHFIDLLPDDLDLATMAQLDKAFNFSNSKNCELADAWYLLSIKTNYTVAFGPMEEFLVHVGRRKFLTPLYKALIKTEQGKALARSIYEKARPNYHFVAVNTLDEVVGRK